MHFPRGASVNQPDYTRTHTILYWPSWLLHNEKNGRLLRRYQDRIPSRALLKVISSDIAAAREMTRELRVHYATGLIDSLAS